jgi:hypothetical protein
MESNNKNNMNVDNTDENYVRNDLIAEFICKKNVD